MKTIIKNSLLIFAIFVLSLFLPINVAAQTETLENIVLGKEEVVESLYLKAGQSLTIKGTIKNDAYLFGGLVTFDGKVEGDLFVAGGMVTIKGEVGENLWVGGGIVTIDSKIGKNLTVVGGNIIVGTDTEVKGNLMGAGGNFDLSGKVEKEAKIGAGNINLGGTIKGDAEMVADTLIANKETEIEGNFTYTVSKEKAQIDEEAKFSGTVTQKEPQVKVGKEGREDVKEVLGILRVANFGFKVFWFLGVLLTGLLLVLLAPRQVNAISKIIGERPLASLGLGFALPFAFLAVFVILLITLIGIPLALILTGAFFLMLYLSPIFISILIGQKLFEREDRKISLIWLLIGGLLIWEIVTFLPYIGGLIKIVGVLLSLGGIVLFTREALVRLKEAR